MNIIPRPKKFNEGRSLPEGIHSEKKIYTNVSGFMLDYVKARLNPEVMPSTSS